MTHWQTEICVLHWQNPDKEDKPLHSINDQNLAADDDLLGGMGDESPRADVHQFFDMEAAEAGANDSDDEEMEVPSIGHFDPIADVGKLFGEKRRKYCFSV